VFFIFILHIVCHERRQLRERGREGGREGEEEGEGEAKYYYARRGRRK
jgi:hypothetical protein